MRQLATGATECKRTLEPAAPAYRLVGRQGASLRARRWAGGMIDAERGLADASTISTHMKTLRLIPTASFIVLVLLGTAALAAPAGGGWVSLFNGRNLDGWEQKNGTAKYAARDNAIVGTSVPKSPNSFLCTKKKYGDFELEFEVMVDKELNSGVQIRSESRPDYQNGRVHGYQVEIAVGGFSGGIYDEARRGKFLNEAQPTAEIRALLKADEWNRYRVVCQGDHLQVWVNGVKVTDLRDKMTASGFIGLQVHAVGDRTDPLTVKWRNLRLKELK